MIGISTSAKNLSDSVSGASLLSLAFEFVVLLLYITTGPILPPTVGMSTESLPVVS